MSTTAYWAGRHVVYRFYDAGGRLIYLGRTNHMPRRVSRHRRAWWWRLVAKTRVQVFRSFDDADEAERIALRSERPVFNNRGTGTGTSTAHWKSSDRALHASHHGGLVGAA